jgi:hypothetical protein
MLSCVMHVEAVLCYLSVHLCSEWRIQQIEECQLVHAARPLGLPLLCYYGVQSGTLHGECICVRRDGVALL